MPKKKYSIEDLKNAISAVKQKKMTVREAAEEYGIPKSTLDDHIRRTPKPTNGPDRQLTEEEESALVNFMVYVSDQGFPLTRAMARCYIQEIVRKSGRNVLFNMEKGPSNRWFRKFLSRHPSLSELQTRSQDKTRTKLTNNKTVERFFQFLDGLLGENNIKDKPAQIFNCDETGWSRKEDSKESGGKQNASTSNDHTTAHLCVSAEGRFLPSMIVFQGSLPHRNFTASIPDSWLFAFSESGYMDGDLFYKWFTCIFIPNCGQERPVVLLMDNHDAHMSLKVVEAAIANQIVLVGLPGHTQNFLQPIDKKLIKPLKSEFSSIASSMGFEGKTIGKAKFPIILKKVIDQTTPALVQSAFVVTGICPFNPSAIERSQLIPPAFETTNDDPAAERVRNCQTCGSYLINPLVQRGLIPLALSDILHPSPSNIFNTHRGTRIVTEGRVMSGSEILNVLKEKEDQPKHPTTEPKGCHKVKELIKKKRKRGPEETDRKAKKQKIQEKKRRRKEKTIQNEEEKTILKGERQLGGRLAKKRYTCGVCAVRGRVNDEERGILWFGCDEEACLRWYHYDCLSESEKESLKGERTWQCRRCKPWLYTVKE